MSEITFKDETLNPSMEEQYQEQQNKGINVESSAEGEEAHVERSLEIRPEEPKEEVKEENKEEPPQELSSRTEAEKALQNASLDIEAFENEFATQGTLSEESYAKLEKAGFKREMVERYIQASTIISDNMIQSIQGIVGGKEQYKKISEWAMENLPASEVEAYNKIMYSNDVNLIRLAVENLGYKYKQANGSKPDRTFHGQTSASTATAPQGYRSTAEMVQAMRDPRYGKDPAYTKDVEHRVSYSNFS